MRAGGDRGTRVVPSPVGWSPVGEIRWPGVYFWAMTSENPPVISRFAPSPTGYLHLGHLVNAIYVWGLSRALGGEVILRLEDHDRGRCRPEYESGILEDLEWLNLEANRGVTAQFRAGPTPFRQSDNTERYEAVLAHLAARDLVYTCTCSRRDIQSRTGTRNGTLSYDGYCRGRRYRPDMEGGTRLMMPSTPVEFLDVLLGTQVQHASAPCDDLLLRDRHGWWTYHFAVTVDDWDQGVNLVIRGEDLLDSTGRQLHLAKLLGRNAAPLFLHHPLLADGEGRKLSKRDLAKGLRDYRAEGWTPERLLGEAAARVGLVSPGTALEGTGLEALFDGSTVVKTIEALRSGTFIT